ncbi:MAG: hypothetical protein DMG84_00935 [Acidobacteria bacterium]|nr:MAG: hypothetical protein DMG84_00935 [Acidobacteriota bacterium]
MKALERQISYGSFLDRLRSASARVLLLDYDGTLAPFSADRNLAFPYPEVPDLLARIMAEGTRVVLISGRPARELPTQKSGEAMAWSGSNPTAVMNSAFCPTISKWDFSWQPPL